MATAKSGRSGKSWIVITVVGLVVVGGAYLITQFIQSTTEEEAARQRTLNEISEKSARTLEQIKK